MARKLQTELPEATVDRITANIQSMVDDRVERGVDLSRAMHCDSCGQDKSPAGSSLYGAYKLCNDCLVDLTLALAAGRVDTVVDFMTTKIDGPDVPSAEGLGDERDRAARSRLQGRDKFMPSNEPA